MSIQRVGNGRGSSNNSNTAENNLNFLSIDWNKVKKEVEATNTKYNGPKKQEPLRISQTNRGSMYSQKNQHRISFLEGNSVPSPEQKQVQDVEPCAPHRLESQFNPENRLHTSKSVARLSSSNGEGQGTQGISNFGGPSKYLKSETAPSIWDSETLQRAAQEMADSRASIRNENKSQVEYRRSQRQQGLDNLVEALQNVDTRKSAHISSASDQTVPSEVSDQARYTRNTRNISVFDVIEEQNDFARLNQMTAGERLSERKKAERSQRDQSWKDGGRSNNMRQSVSNLFDMLSQEK